MIDLSHLGTKQQDGSILLFDKNREYKRVRQSNEQRTYLFNQGFQPVQSSNVSALRKDEKDLYIRFLNGSVYVYYNCSDIYDLIINSNSKGHAVWRYLRWAKKPYNKVGKIDFPKELTREVDAQLELLTDAQTFQNIDTAFIYQMTKNVSKATLSDNVQVVNGVQVVMLSVGNQRIYIPLNLLVQ